MKKIKVLFVIPSLIGGGAERIAVLLLEYLDMERFEPILVTFESIEKYKIQGCPDLVTISLDKRTKASNATLSLSLAKVMLKEQPEVTISFMNYANLIASIAKLISFNKTYLIHSDHNNLTELMNMGQYGAFRKLLTRILYKFTNTRVCVSKGVEQDIRDNWGVAQNKYTTIHNPVDFHNIQRLSAEQVSDTWFNEDIPIVIACGRLSAQKNYPMLVEAFTQLSQCVEARLVILGEGELKDDILAIIEKNELKTKVKLLGFVENPFKYLSKSTLFVLSSDSEGFGNVIVEAMACGVPVISTRCPSGPDEIISHMENGLLITVGDAAECANAMQTLLTQQSLRQQLASKGQEKSRDFDITRVVKRYEAIFAGQSLCA